MADKELSKAILNVKAIQFARICSAQENPKMPIVCIDDESNKALNMLIKIAEQNTRKPVEIDVGEIEKIVRKVLEEQNKEYMKDFGIGMIEPWSCINILCHYLTKAIAEGLT